jgi:hypothetical protein
VKSSGADPVLLKSGSFMQFFLAVQVYLKGQSHEKVDELRVWGVSLGPN